MKNAQLKREFVELIRACYGFTVKQATRIYNNSDVATIKEIINGIKRNAKQGFYID